MTDRIRWGVCGPGGIAARFAEAMTMVDDGEIVAVASRSVERADAYADRFGVPRRYASYAALADDPDVDAVYVATRTPGTRPTRWRSWRPASMSCARSRSPSTLGRSVGWSTPRRPRASS